MKLSSSTDGGVRTPSGVSTAHASDRETSQSTPLAAVLRSGELESVHRGSIAVSDSRGRLLAFAGDPAQPVFWRSTAKLHQAIPLVTSGGIERWKLTAEQIAIICASHNGDAEHVKWVSAILRSIGLGPPALHCGSQQPHGQEAANELVRRGEQPGPLHNTCSGNHAGLLALSRLLGAPPENYEQLSHEVQQRALAVVAQFAGVPRSSVFTGIDGCGIPAYRTPLAALATAFARLMDVPAEWDADLKHAAKTITSAVTRHPALITGDGELDTEFMRAFGGAAVCKLGAEAVCAAAFVPSPDFPAGVGIALKIEDGLGNRARSVALAEVVAQLKLGTEAQRSSLEPFIHRVVRTRGGQAVGEIRPEFTLGRPAL